MPIYDYRCEACSSTYDVFHKTREAMADIVCPSCGSTEYKKLMSIPSSLTSSGPSVPASAGESCANPGGCCGGSCGLN